MSNTRHRDFCDSSDDDDIERSYDSDDDDDIERRHNSDDDDDFDIYADEIPPGSDGDEDTDSDPDAETPPPSPPPPPPAAAKGRKRRTAEDETAASSKKKKSGGRDRLGALPDSMILHILSLLPTKDAVRTGTLSKRWRYLWTSVENISFSYHSGPGANYDWQYPAKEEKRANKFITFVDRALVLCAFSNIMKFSLKIDYDRRFAPSVNAWVRFAMQKNVQELELDFYCPRPGHRYKLPMYVYANSYLRKLNMSKCKIDPCKVVSWRLLRVLTLKCAELSEVVVRNILSGSPALEYLELYRCWVHLNKLDFNSESLKKLVIRGYRNPLFEEEDWMVEIAAPNVLSLEITGYFMSKQFRLVNVSSLIEAKLDFDRACRSRDDYIAERDMMTDLLVSLQHVKDLTLGSWCIQALSVLEVKGLPAPLSERKNLTLVTHMKIWELPGIASLLQSSPHLETLVINMASRYLEFQFRSDFLKTYNFDGENYWALQKRDLKCLLLHLRTVKVVGFMGGSNELEAAFLQFVLENAPVLKKMVVSTLRVNCKGDSTTNTSPEFFQMTQKLVSHPRSSPDAVILFPDTKIA